MTNPAHQAEHEAQRLRGGVLLGGAARVTWAEAAERQSREEERRKQFLLASLRRGKQAGVDAAQQTHVMRPVGAAPARTRRVVVSVSERVPPPLPLAAATPIW